MLFLTTLYAKPVTIAYISPPTTTAVKKAPMVLLPLISLRCAYDINPQFSSTPVGIHGRTGRSKARPALEWDHRCINISSATSAPPYIRLKGRAMDFVPLPEGVKLASVSNCFLKAAEAPEN